MVVGSAYAKPALLSYQWDGLTWRKLAPATPKGLEYPVFASVSRPAFCLAVGLRRSSLGTGQLSGFWNGKAWHLVS